MLKKIIRGNVYERKLKKPLEAERAVRCKYDLQWGNMKGERKLIQKNFRLAHIWEEFNKTVRTQSKIAHQRYTLSPRNGPDLVSLSHSVIGWKQSMGSMVFISIYIAMDFWMQQLRPTVTYAFFSRISQRYLHSKYWKIGHWLNKWSTIQIMN